MEDINTTANFSEEQQYQFKPFYGSSHDWAIGELKKTNKDSSVLDFGAGTGFAGLILRDLGVNNIYAIDTDQERKRKLAQIYQEAKEDISLISQQNFDLICLLDILEHLTDPFERLQQLSKQVNPGGRILISLPNIAHWSIRGSLLFGYFEYTNRGLLDKTHYNFFNKKRALKLAASLHEFTLKSYSVSISPVEYFLPEDLRTSQPMLLFNKFRLKAANLLPNLLGYQHLLLLEKNK